MNVGQTGGVGGPQPIQPGSNRKPVSPVPSSEPTARTDKAEISSHARLLQKLREMPDMRTDLVDEVKSQIEDGTYETEDRIRAAVDRMFEELQ